MIYLKQTIYIYQFKKVVKYNNPVTLPIHIIYT